MFRQRLTIRARFEHLQKVRQIVEQAASAAGLSPRDSYGCQLAVSEALENIIRHGYGGETDLPIGIDILADADTLTIEVEDRAPPFNPAAPPPERELDAKNPPVGGLGLRIIHRAMDEVEYQRRGDANWLRMRKRAAQDQATA